MNSIQAVIFDWAGTVIDFGSCGPIAAFVAAFEAVDFHITETEARAPMGRGKRDHIASVLRHADVADRWRRQHGCDADDVVVDEIYQRFLPLQLDVITQHCQLIDGVAEVCDRLASRGIKIGSTTGYTREIMDRIAPIAARAGFEPLHIGTSSDPCPGRPAPWLIYRNCEAMNVYPISGVVKVDDTTVGIEAGRNAGCRTVGVSGSGNLMGLRQADYEALEPGERARRVQIAERRLRDAGAHDVIETVADLPACLDRLEAGAAPIEVAP